MCFVLLFELLGIHRVKIQIKEPKFEYFNWIFVLKSDVLAAELEPSLYVFAAKISDFTGVM